MNAIVPDTLQGALIVSVIDFFLSFLIISGIGVILSLFPVLNRLATVFGPQPKEAAAPARANKAAAEGKVSTANTTVNTGAPDDIAAIAAAVFVLMDGQPHRILNITPSAGRSPWVAEGRIAQHGTHTRSR
jgi:hypothetical protein